jgi:hypothetical protein
MAIYLGEAGHIELQRRSINDTYSFALDPEDVDVLNKRFSFEGLDQDVFLVTGDRVSFEREGGSNLELLDGVTDQTGITQFVHIDSVGGIRLFATFNESLNGLKSEALELTKPTTPQQLTISLQEVDWRCLAQVQQYSLTTARETIDLTELGDDFRRNYASGLINGQGSCTCFWDYTGKDEEYANYLAKLVLRLNLGAAFNGKFYIKKGAYSPQNIGCSTTEQRNQALWWEALCIVTNVSMAFTPTEAIQTQIEFVTSGKFTLRAGLLPSYLLQEDDGLILDEELDQGIVLDEDT